MYEPAWTVLPGRDDDAVAESRGDPSALGRGEPVVCRELELQLHPTVRGVDRLATGAGGAGEALDEDPGGHDEAVGHAGSGSDDEVHAPIIASRSALVCVASDGLLRGGNHFVGRTAMHGQMWDAHVMTRLGYQVPNFTYPGVGSDGLFEAVAAQAVEAEESGFDTVLVMDHFYQLPMLGAPDNAMIECYTLLAALSQRTSRVRLSALVTGNTYRHPSLLAKTVTALDVVSGGRAQLGIGAGWFELEHDSLGFEFGTFTDRFEKLEEALRIVIPMLRGERPSLEGTWYSVHEAINSPAPVGRIPVMIGGGGEKKTLRMVAQYADESNIICAPDEIPRKLAALDEHCERLGRDRSEITVTYQTSAVIAPTKEQAQAELDAAVAAIPELAARAGGVILGSPDEVRPIYERILASGVDGVTVNLPANGHVPGRVALLGETLAPVVNRS